jgi:hypothetical protein
MLGSRPDYHDGVTFPLIHGLIEGVRFGFVLISGMCLVSRLVGQECPAVARLQPVGSLSGTLDTANCLLTDGSVYAAYRLDLPVRGKLGIDLSGTSSDLLITLRDESGAHLEGGTAIRRQVEAGSYRLLVNGKGPGQAGGYKVVTSFTAESATLCANFANLGKRQTVSGLLGSYGCLAPDGTPYDAYTVTTNGSGTVTVTATSPDFTPAVTLRDSDGRSLATSVDGMLIAPVLGDSQYFVVVDSSDKAGAYTLATSFENAPDDTCRTRRAFAESDTDVGTINAESCYETIPGSGDQLYYNDYNLTLAAAGAVTLSVTTGDFTPTLYLLDEAGNTLALDFVGGGYDFDGKATSHLRVQLPAGNYVAQVYSDVASGGTYRLQYGYTAERLPVCKPIAVTPGDAQNGAISSASCRTSLGLGDLYTFTLAAAGTLELDLGSPDFTGVLAIRDQKDNLIVRSDEIDSVTTAHISADLAAGVYTVVAAASSFSGKYRLTSKFTAHDVPACTYTQALDLNGGYIQRLNLGGCKAANGQPVDYYGFTLSADSLVLAVMTSSEVDGFLTLYDSAGNVVRTDDNSYGGIDPLIVQYLPAGTYKLAVRGALAASGGLYEVDLRTVPGPRPPLCGSRGTLELGGSVSGNITYTGCQYTDKTFADVYQMTLTSDAAVDLRLNAVEFDAYLIVLDAKGNLVEDDDNGGGGSNARITQSLPAGTYYVVAKPLGDYLAHGAYTLTAKTVE